MYGSTSYWMVGLEPKLENFVYFLVNIFLTINVGFGISQVISAASKTVAMAIAIYMVVLVYSLLMGGFLVSKSDLPKPINWILYTSYFYYGFQGLVVNEFEDKSYGGLVLEGMDMGGTDKYTNLAILSVLWLFLQVISMNILIFFNKEKR
eukprot:TRINITY_DN6509_c0_g1_i3.p1 TRINITY_DN6509_c0_g1~~TRINITY_DN6509_c0_g1_i3.p1  ORF type:complete len:150 (-),score=27.23 TRINITY_DN6509_c0_g1_i3:180-629(-)